MKKLLKAIIYGLVALVVAVVGGAYTLPDTARVERAIVINSEPATVYAVVSDLKRMKDWSPWQGLDPKAVYSFEGPAQGQGQKMSWKSNDPKVGNGSQTIIEVEPDKKVVTELDFGEMGKAKAIMSLAPVTGGTSVVWSFESKLSGVMDRWAGLFFDKWIGADYQKGLQSLKALVEADASSG